MKQKSLGKYLTHIFSVIKGQYLAPKKIQIVKQIGCVDACGYFCDCQESIDSNDEKLAGQLYFSIASRISRLER